MGEKKRLTLTGKNIPDNIYEKLDKLANEKRLTNYIVSLVEKEESLVEKESMMDKMNKSLSTMLSKMDKLDEQMEVINQRLENINVVSAPVEAIKEDRDIETDPIQQGDIGVNTDKIRGEQITEDDEYDF